MTISLDVQGGASSSSSSEMILVSVAGPQPGNGSEVHQLLTALETQAKDLRLDKPDEICQVCVALREQIDILSEKTGALISGISREMTEVQEAILKNVRTYNELNEQVGRARYLLNEAQMGLAELRSEIEQNQERTQELEWESQVYQGKAHEVDGERLVNPFMDVPVAGLPVTFFHCLFTGGDFKRMIPFYSQGRAIASAIVQDREEFQERSDRLKEEREALLARIKEKEQEDTTLRRAMQKQEEDLRELELRKKDLVSKRKCLAAELTSFTQFKGALQVVRGQYDFLTMDIEVLEVMVQGGLFTQELITDFLGGVRRLRCNFEGRVGEAKEVDHVQ